MTENLKAREALTQNDKVPSSDVKLLDVLIKSVDWRKRLQEELQKKESDIKKAIENALWSPENRKKVLMDAYSKASNSQEKDEIATLAVHFWVELWDNENPEMKEAIATVKRELKVLESDIRNDYRNLKDDKYGEKSEHMLSPERDKRNEEDLAIADLLLDDKDRPHREAVKLYDWLSRKSAAMRVMKEAIAKVDEWKHITSSVDIQNLPAFSSEYNDSSSSARTDAWRILLLVTKYKDDIKEEKITKQAEMFKFVKKIKNWNSMTNVLAYVLNKEEWKDKWKWEWKTLFTKEDIKNDPTIWEYYWKKRFLTSESWRIVKLLNSATRENMQKIIDIKWKKWVDVRDAYNARTFVETNIENSTIFNNPFLLLSDLNMTWNLDRGNEWRTNGHRWSEQQLYANFLSVADTEEVSVDGTTEKRIKNGPKTKDLIDGFKLLLKGTEYWKRAETAIQSWNLDEFAVFLRNNPESIALYHKQLDRLSYDKKIDIQDLLLASKLKELSKKDDLEAASELNSIRDETKDWFMEQLNSFPKGSQEREWFDSLDAQSKLSTVRKIIDLVDKVPNAFLNLAGFSVQQWNTLSKKDILKTVTFKPNFLKDDAWIGPRVMFWFDSSKISEAYHAADNWAQIWDAIESRFNWCQIWIDIPLVNLTWNFDLNQWKVLDENMRWVKAVNKMYSRLGANFQVYAMNWRVKDNKLWLDFKLALEAAFGWKADYKEPIELKWYRLWEVMEKVFENPDFSSKDKFKESINTQLKALEDDSNFKKYLKNNPEFKFYIVDEVADSLDRIGIFTEGKAAEWRQEHAKIVLNYVLKWILEEIKNENMQALNWKTKLTRLWVFWQIWAYLWRKTTTWENWETIVHHAPFHLSVWLERSISSWKLLYAPDSEKYKYMDESLKSWESADKVKWATNTPDALRSTIQELLTSTTITGLETKMNDKNELEITVPDATLAKYKKGSIAELFNVYVNPSQLDNIAIEKNKITLWNVGKLSVVTRNYFDDFALYLFVWGNWVDWCEKNKVSGLKDKSDKMKWFEFKAAQEWVEASNKPAEFEYKWFDFENLYSSLDAKQKLEFWRIDNITKKGWDFIKAMNEWNVDGALVVVLWMLEKFEYTKPLSDYLKEHRNDEDKTALIQTLNTLKAELAIANVHDRVWLKLNLDQRREVFASLDWFPLDKNAAVAMRGELVNQAINGAKNGKIEYPVCGNVVWYTAFYAKDNHVGRWFSSNALGNNHILGWEDNVKLISQGDVPKVKEWMKGKMDSKDSESYNVILDQIKWNLPESILKRFTNSDGDNNELKTALGTLFWEWKANFKGVEVSLEREYIFYLLWECANESLGVRLWKIKIEWQEAVAAEDQLDVFGDTQSLTQTQYLDEKRLNWKFNVFGWDFNNKKDIQNKHGSDPIPNNPPVNPSQWSEPIVDNTPVSDTGNDWDGVIPD